MTYTGFLDKWLFSIWHLYKQYTDYSQPSIKKMIVEPLHVLLYAQIQHACPYYMYTYNNCFHFLD